MQTLDQVHCIRDNIVAHKSAPIPFHPTQLVAIVLNAFDKSYGLVFKDFRKVMSFHWPLTLSNGGGLVSEHKRNNCTHAYLTFI